MLELREVVAADGTRSRPWQWVAAYALSGRLLLAGLIAVAAMMTA